MGFTLRSDRNPKYWIARIVSTGIYNPQDLQKTLIVSGISAEIMRIMFFT